MNITFEKIEKIHNIGCKFVEIQRRISAWKFHKKCRITIVLQAILGRSEIICLYNGRDSFFDIIRDEEKYWRDKGFYCYTSRLPLYSTGSLVINVEKNMDPQERYEYEKYREIKNF